MVRSIQGGCVGCVGCVGKNRVFSHTRVCVCVCVRVRVRVCACARVCGNVRKTLHTLHTLHKTPKKREFSPLGTQAKQKKRPPANPTQTLHKPYTTTEKRKGEPPPWAERGDKTGGQRGWAATTWEPLRAVFDRQLRPMYQQHPKKAYTSLHKPTQPYTRDSGKTRPCQIVSTLTIA